MKAAISVRAIQWILVVLLGARSETSRSELDWSLMAMAAENQKNSLEKICEGLGPMEKFSGQGDPSAVARRNDGLEGILNTLKESDLEKISPLLNKSLGEWIAEEERKKLEMMLQRESKLTSGSSSNTSDPEMEMITTIETFLRSHPLQADRDEKLLALRAEASAQGLNPDTIDAYWSAASQSAEEPVRQKSQTDRKRFENALNLAHEHLFTKEGCVESIRVLDHLIAHPELMRSNPLASEESSASCHKDCYFTFMKGVATTLAAGATVVSVVPHPAAIALGAAGVAAGGVGVVGEYSQCGGNCEKEKSKADQELKLEAAKSATKEIDRAKEVEFAKDEKSKAARGQNETDQSKGKDSKDKSKDEDKNKNKDDSKSRKEQEKVKSELKDVYDKVNRSQISLSEASSAMEEQSKTLRKACYSENKVVRGSKSPSTSSGEDRQTQEQEILQSLKTLSDKVVQILQPDGLASNPTKVDPMTTPVDRKKGPSQVSLKLQNEKWFKRTNDSARLSFTRSEIEEAFRTDTVNIPMLDVLSYCMGEAKL